jgi:putative endonuclease
MKKLIMYYTYILYSEKLKMFYVGQTSDIEERLQFHNGGFEKYTSKGCPWVLVWCVEKSTRKEALGLEQKLKNLSQMRKVNFMKKYGENLLISLESIGFEP